MCRFLYVILVIDVAQITLATFCTLDSHCPAYQLCLNGSCSRGATGTGVRCNNSSNCSSCLSNECACNSSSLFASPTCPENEVCSNGICSEPACTNQEDCAAGEICQESRCANCSKSDQCPVGQWCTNGKCLVYGKCNLDSDCLGNWSSCVNGTCQYASRQTCQNGRCVSSPSSSLKMVLRAVLWMVVTSGALMFITCWLRNKVMKTRQMVQSQAISTPNQRENYTGQSTNSSYDSQPPSYREACPEAFSPPPPAYNTFFKQLNQ